MKVDKNCLYSVAPLTKQERDEVIKKLRAKHLEPSGIPTFHICREVTAMWPDKENNMCAMREDRYQPCTTLCYVCVEILHTLLRRDRAYLKREGLEDILK